MSSPCSLRVILVLQLYEALKHHDTAAPRARFNLHGETAPLRNVSAPQLVGAPSLCRTCSASPPVPLGCRQSASSRRPPSPSCTPCAAPLPRPQQSSRKWMWWTRASFLRGCSAPSTSCYRSAPPTRHSKAPWSRPSATTCTSCPQTADGSPVAKAAGYLCLVFNVFFGMFCIFCFGAF